jgi:hypothetical protein
VVQSAVGQPCQRGFTVTGPGDIPAISEAIKTVLARYCFLIDEYRIEELGSLFVDDCITDYGPGLGGEIVGREPLLHRISESQARFRRTHHQLGHSVFDYSVLQTPAVETAAFAVHEWPTGQQDILWFRYSDRLRLDDGAWRFVSRRLLLATKQGLPETEFAYVARYAPS